MLAVVLAWRSGRAMQARHGAHGQDQDVGAGFFCHVACKKSRHSSTTHSRPLSALLIQEPTEDGGIDRGLLSYRTSLLRWSTNRFRA